MVEGILQPSGTVPEILLVVLPNHVGAWESTSVPKDAGLGMYRVVKPLEINGRIKFRTATFRVVR
jgi:hypothetical protein